MRKENIEKMKALKEELKAKGKKKPEVKEQPVARIKPKSKPAEEKKTEKEIVEIED